MAERRDKFEAQHAKNRLLYERKIKRIFTKVCQECGMSVTQLASIVESAGKDAKIAQIPAVRKVLDKLQRQLAKELNTTVIDGVKAEWKLANDKYDALIGTMAAGDLLEKMDEAAKARTFARNLEALDAFIKRKDGGLDLSQRVWQYSGQMRDAMEAALALGISEGESAAEIARDLKQYLNYPDKLFRRVRDKETGELKLSKPASMFHPGQGVYRSSYKNALRLALNETNIAYRKADSIRRVGLDFVVGIEIHLSNNHNCKGVPEGEFFDICDLLKGKYPPDFEFVGWHPNCYSDDSEVLTNRGWLLFRDVLPNDWVLSLNPDTRRLEWTTIVATQSYRYAGRMVRFHNRSLDCLVTPEHRMVYLNKADGRIKYCEAAEYTKGKGGFYRGCEYSAEDINTLTIGGTTYDFDAFCRFMGYWLADGACFNTSGITISQNDGEAAKPNIIEAVKALGYEPTVYPDSVRFYHSAFVRYLRRFGHCKDKYIPDEIKRASRRQIALFLDAFVECDGSIRPPKDFVGNRGTHFHSERGERVFFTTSRRMAGDLCELILKAGGRPSVREREPGAATKKDGTVIRSNYTCFVISDLKAVTATVFDKEFVDYDGMVYDLTLAKNHIMYIKREGRCFWGSNCRCWTSSILQTEAEFFRDSDGKYRGSVNEVKDVPPQFKEWLEKNGDRITAAEERGTLPYFLRDNRWAWQDEAERPNEKVEYKNTALDAAEKRHASRTDKQVKAVREKWEMRRRALKNQRHALSLLDAIPGMEEYLKKSRGYSIKLLRGIEPLDGEYDVLDAAARSAVEGMAKLKKEFAVLDKPLDTMKKWGVDTTRTIVSNVKRTMSRYDGLSWKEKADKFRYEARWIEENRKDTIPTWREAQAAYLKAAKMADYKAEWSDLEDKFKDLAKKATDTAIVDQIRAAMGKDKDAVKKMLKELELSNELLDIQQKYDILVSSVPERALPKPFRNDVEKAIAARNLVAARSALSVLEIGVKAWEDAADKIRALMPEVKDAALRSEILRVLKDSTIAEITDCADKVGKYVEFERLRETAKGLLDKRDVLEKLAPAALQALEYALNEKAMDPSALKIAISRLNSVLADWDDMLDDLKDYEGYATTSKSYLALVDDAKKAAAKYDEPGLLEALQKLKDKKEELERVRAYDVSVAAEWRKMKDDVAKISAALNKDADLLSKAATSGLLSAIVDFNANADGSKKLREARATYKQIMAEASQMGLTDGKVTLDDLKRRLGDKLPETLKVLDKAIKKVEKGGVSSSNLKDRDRVEKFMLEWLSQGDLGMNIKEHNLEKVLTSWFKNTFEVGTSGGYRGPSGDLSVERGGIPTHHGRLEFTHKHFLNGRDLNDQLKRKEYEKYGNLMNNDILTSLNNNHGDQYGPVQVRFKKDKVIATWTPNDSLGGTQPSLVTDPKIASFGYSSVPNSSMSPRKFEDAFNKFIFGYCELQFHGDLTPDCVESLAFPYDITTRPDSLRIAQAWIAKYGVTVYYLKDRNTLMTL